MRSFVPSFLRSLASLVETYHPSAHRTPFPPLGQTSDLDYLSQVPPLVAMLGVTSDSMRHNPLMLENSLSESSPPVVGEDSRVEEDEWGEQVAASRAAEKARLRQAEAVLVAEERSAQPRRAPSTAPPPSTWESTAASLSRGRAQRPVAEGAGPGGLWEGREEELLGWYDDATAQLTRLREPVAAHVADRSTGRMAVRGACVALC